MIRWHSHANAKDLLPLLNYKTRLRWKAKQIVIFFFNAVVPSIVIDEDDNDPTDSRQG
jgi:hypothetical protein